MTPDRGLQERHRREREFHDRWAESVGLSDLDPARAASCPTTPETTWALRALGEVGGRRVLDLGCGCGETTAWLAMNGARVEAVDISPKMIEVARRVAERAGVSDRIGFHVGAGERLPFGDGVFEAVFGQDVLHHLDLGPTSAELRRVLSPGGRAVFVEPLGHNPILNLFRALSRQTRTPDERPLRFADFPRLAAGFRSFAHREFQLTTLALFLWFYLVERADPNTERYWKKIIVEAERYRRPFAALDAIDRALLAVCPPAGRLCRMTAMVLER